jgi:predicted dehydrogenase
MKVTVIGNGSIGRRHLKGITALQEELKVSEVRAFDTNPERRSQVKEEIPSAINYESLEEAINGTDVVFMCAPTSLHIPIYEQISKLGDFHIFYEKPLSHTIEGCEKMVFDQKQKGKEVAVGYMLHHHPVLLTAKEIIESGKLGRILTVRAEAGFFLPQWHPWEDYREFYMSWKTGGGGALLDISHEINYLQWIFGDIEEVQGMMGTISDLEITSDDIAVAIMKFKNGIVGQLQLDLLQFDEARFCKVIGTEGVMIADIAKNKITYNTKDNQEWTEQKLEVNFDEIYHTEYRNIFAAFQGKDGYTVSGDESYATMEVIEAIRRSHTYGTRVKLPLYD